MQLIYLGGKKVISAIFQLSVLHENNYLLIIITRI